MATGRKLLYTVHRIIFSDLSGAKRANILYNKIE